MRAVVAASAWPSHFAITASGTPRRCSAVPTRVAGVVQPDRSHTGHPGQLVPHAGERVGRVRLPGLIHRDVAAVGVRRAQRQPVLRIADEARLRTATSPSSSGSVRHDDSVFGSFSMTEPAPA